jgi:ABC-type dipeptide/oligopeptide/nickel transport system permease component
MLLIQGSEGLRETAPIAFEETTEFFSQLREGDLGSYEADNQRLEVVEMLRTSFLASMGLLFAASLLAALVGVLLGIFVALSKRGFFAFSVLAGTIVGISLPSFFAAMLLQHSMIVYIREFDSRLLSVAGFDWDYQHMILPILVLAARPVAYLMRTTYVVLKRTMEEDYIRTAKSKGLGRRYIVNVHAMRNVAVPILTAIGVSWRFSLGILPIVEYMFAWPGMGLRMLEGINSQQASIVAPLSMIFGLTLLLGNLVLDIAYRIVDPRVRDDA